MVTAIAERPGSGLEQPRAMSVAHVESIMDHPAYHDVIRQGVKRRLQARLTEEQRPGLVRLLGYRDRYEDLFLLVIEAGIADGSMRPLPESRIAARALIGGLNAVNVWLRYCGALAGTGSPRPLDRRIQTPGRGAGGSTFSTPPGPVPAPDRAC